MNSSIRFSSLPDSRKPEAAKSLLAGEGWYFFGDLVQHPGADELRRWAGNDAQSPQAGAEGAGSIRTEGGISVDIAHPRTRDGKRLAVDSALAAHPDASNRELARITGTTHPFVAQRRRKAGNVTVADVEKC